MLDLEAIEARLAAATPEPWAVGILDPDLPKGKLFEDYLSVGSGAVFTVWCPKHPRTVGGEPRPKHAVLAAITGNGPTSEANAVFIAAAPDDVRALIDEVVRLRGWLAEDNESAAARIVAAEIEGVRARGEIKQLRAALTAHRVDLHQSSTRPCATCRQSAEVLGKGAPGGCTGERRRDVAEAALEEKT